MNKKYLKLKILFLIKWLIVAAFILLVILNSRKTKVSNTDFSEMSKAVENSVKLNDMISGDAQMLRRLYGLNENDFDGFILYYPKTNMNAEELLLIKLKDIDQKNAVEHAINNRLGIQKKSFDGYGADQTAMLEKSIVKIVGNYALFVSAENPQAVLTVFEHKY